jgi:tyrosyl-tRNA synthetase
MFRRFYSVGVLKSLEKRNLISQISDRNELETHLKSYSIVYTGFDPTAKSLHVGNLLTIVALIHFQIHGHGIIALIGGATGAIGDPSGKSTERNTIDAGTIEHNVNSIKIQLQTIFKNASLYAKRKGHLLSGPVQIANNYQWFRDITMIDFISNYGKLFRVNAMMTKDSVRTRLHDHSGISFSEFTYQILQAYDFWMLYKLKGCTVQVI